MNLASKLAARAEAGNPVRVGLIGAGKFGSMILAQARLTPGIQIMGIAEAESEADHEQKESRSLLRLFLSGGQE